MFSARGMKKLFRERGARTGIAFALPGALFLLLFVAYPVVDAIRLSFVEIGFASGKETFVGLENFRAIFMDAKLAPVLGNTVLWSLGSLAGQFALGLIAALCINQNLPGMRLVRSVLLLPYVVPVITLALFWRWMLDGTYGILSHALQVAGALDAGQSPLASPNGAMASVIIANVWRGFPFVMISYWAALQSIPAEQYEAARVDGASVLQEFRYVTLPNLAEVTRALIVLRVIWTVTYFDLVWLISRGGPAGATEHWPIWIYQETMGSFRFGYGAALATTLAAGIFLAGLVYFRWARREIAE